MMTCSSSTHRLEVVPGGGPMVAQRVLLGPGFAPGTHVLALQAGSSWVPAAVDVVISSDVPSQVLAISRDLAADLRLVDTDVPPWRLDRMDPVQARQITLELPTERNPKDAARDIARSGLVGRLLWVPSDGTDIELQIDDVPYRVRSVETDGQVGVPVELTSRTEVELYAPAARAGVDIVVLADCSGSMSIDDLPVTGERPRLWGQQHRWITRIEALREALQDLLAMRLQVSGRASQIALLQFDDKVTQRFPRQGGMTQLDAGSPERVVQEFRDSVGMLRPARAGTDIGTAMHEAANLLYQHGRPGNERLIVLVSDGADWRPAGEQGTGEMVYAYQEPVSLMAHLNRDMGIKLHAIGISTAELFHRRGKWEPHPSSVPNHTLLEELVKVGGGDPTTVGGLDVLEDYFADLGSGIVHRVTDRLSDMPSANGPLSGETRAALRELLAPAHSWDSDRRDRHALLSSLVGLCGAESQRVTGYPLWESGKWSQTLTHDCGRTASSDADLVRFVRAISRAFTPNQHAANRLEGRSIDLWNVLLRDLSEAVSGETVDGERLSMMCQRQFGSPAEAQVVVMGLICELLAELRSELSQRPDAIDPADDGEPEQQFSFRYRD